MTVKQVRPARLSAPPSPITGPSSTLNRLTALGHPPTGEVVITASGATLRSEAYHIGPSANLHRASGARQAKPASLCKCAPPDDRRDALTDTVVLQFQAGPPVTLTFTDPPGPVSPGAEALAA